MIRKTFVMSLLLALSAVSLYAAPPSARDLVVAGRIDDAVTMLRSRLTANPQDAEAYHLLGRAYYSIQRWDDSIRNGERAVALQPNNSDYHLWLGRAYGEKADSSSFLTAAELAKKVRTQFELAVQLNPTNFSARSDLSEYYIGAPGFLGGGKDKARAQADQIANGDPSTSHWIRAAIAEKDKNYAIAEQELKQSIQSSKVPSKRWLDLASFYRRRSRFNEMEQAINTAVNVPGREPNVLYDAAEILSRAGRNFTGAVQMLRSYLNSGDPSDDAPLFQAHYLLGTILEKTGDRSGAAQEYRASLSLARDFEKAQSALKRVQ